MSEIEERSLAVEMPITELDLAIDLPSLPNSSPDPLSDLDSDDLEEVSPELVLPEIFQVRLKTQEGKLHLYLPTEQKVEDAEGNALPSLDWMDLMSQLEQRLSAGDRFWQPETPVYLEGGDRLLDPRQLQEIGEALQPHGLKLQQINTQRRQTAIAAATVGFSVEQGAIAQNLTSKKDENALLDEPLYVKMTVRSGTEIRHSGTVIIFGDVNAGGEVIADGDILVWGKLRGKAHAGARGNAAATIMALHLDATQLRIADCIALVEPPSGTFSPEVAYVIVDQDLNICIVPAAEYKSS